MNMLKYKDYQGSVFYEDGVLIIKVLHIADSISTECDSASNAQAAFEELVDDYIDTCAQLGRAAEKPYRGSFNVRVGPDLHKQASLAAAACGENLNAWVTNSIKLRLSYDRPDHVAQIFEAVEILEQRTILAKTNYASYSLIDLLDKQLSDQKITNIDELSAHIDSPAEEVRRYDH